MQPKLSHKKSSVKTPQEVKKSSDQGLALFPVKAWYPASVGVFPAIGLLQAQRDVLAVEAKKGVPRVGPLMLRKTGLTESIFQKTMGQFQQHYGELDGWRDAVRLGISYALQDFVHVVESKAGGLNDQEFAFSYKDWDTLKKAMGTQVTP